MDKYKIIKIIGDGTFGVVSKAVCISTGEVVAIKMMKKKFGSWDECIQLREVKSLKKLIHPNIVRLKEVIRVNDVLHLVFEYIDDNLYNYSKNRSSPFNEKEIQAIIYQTIQGLSYMHKHGFFHRDMKPENLLIDPTNLIIKLCDFGQAREIRSMPPYTDYISTRWYRAPECILKSTIYNSPIDIFGLGCIMAELFLMKPLFPGSSENDQLFKICSLLGSPTKDQWPDGFKLASKLGYNFPNFSPTPLSSIITNASKEGIDLMYSMMKFDPQKRITASQALNHPFFQSYVPKPISSTDSNTTRKRTPEFSAVMNKNQEENKINSNDNHFPLNEESKSYLNIPGMNNVNRSNIEEPHGQETSTYNLNSSFESGSSSSSKQVKTLKDNLKNCRSQRKIPGWMQENEVSAEILGIEVNNISKINNIEEDLEALTSNKIIPNQDHQFKIPNNNKDEQNLNAHQLLDNDLPLTRLSKNKNESSKIKNSINPSIEKVHYQPQIKDPPKIISSPYLEKNENDPLPYMPSQPSLSSESNFEYHKKHNISQNIFLKNQVNQAYMPKSYIQSKFAIDNRVLNPYIDQGSKASLNINTFFTDEPMASGNFNIMESNEKKIKEKETDILDDFVKNHSLQSNPSSFNTNNEYNTFNYGRFNYK